MEKMSVTRLLPNICTDRMAETRDFYKGLLGFEVGFEHQGCGECVLRYDNEAGKGDHRHYRGKESKYTFSTPEKLVADFQRDIARWNDENSHP